MNRLIAFLEWAETFCIVLELRRVALVPFSTFWTLHSLLLQQRRLADDGLSYREGAKIFRMVSSSSISVVVHVSVQLRLLWLYITRSPCTQYSDDMH